jgi:hypothetical protein
MRNITLLHNSFVVNFVSENERNLELASYAAPRAERCSRLDSAAYIFRGPSQVHFGWSHGPYCGKLKAEGPEI